MNTSRMAAEMAADDRPRIASMGEYYADLIAIDAAINRRSLAQQATSLLCAKLQQRKDLIHERVNYLAAKRGISFEAMWLQLLKGEYEPLTSDELEAVETLAPFYQNS